MVLEYDHHLSAVNTLTFFDEGRRFISTSDDKKVLVWDYNTPVPIKYIADPSLHAVSAVAMHPDGTNLACQSMDNTIIAYHTGEKVGRNAKKLFKGHVAAGFACQPSFSADGHFLVTGDGEGTLHFYDWRNGRVLSKLKAHADGPAIGTAWHPSEPSLVASCGWDGVIKLWD